MRFTETAVSGAIIIIPDLVEDERGFFARVHCEQEFSTYGIHIHLSQSSLAFNRSSATLRGIHYQIEPHAEAKLVRCTMGVVYDVIVDLRPQSPTFGKWTSIELSSTNRHSLFIPRGVAHGYETLVPNTEVCYGISEQYHPDLSAGIRWDDPDLGIEWPLEPCVISSKDQHFPLFRNRR